MIITKDEGECDHEANRSKIFEIPRIHHTQLSDPIDFSVEISRYRGPSNPDMSVKESKITEREESSISTLHKHASEMDMQFLKDVVFLETCPEYNGYNTRFLRNICSPIKQKTAVIYQPLIDMKPTEPDTIITAMLEAQRLSEQAGQSFTVLTCDQQLYKIALQVKWNEPIRFSNMTIRLGVCTWR